MIQFVAHEFYSKGLTVWAGSESATLAWGVSDSTTVGQQRGEAALE
jgi:hypothetical protein